MSKDDLERLTLRGVLVKALWELAVLERKAGNRWRANRMSALHTVVCLALQGDEERAARDQKPNPPDAAPTKSVHMHKILPHSKNRHRTGTLRSPTRLSN